MLELLIILWFCVVMCVVSGFILGYLFGKTRTIKYYEDNRHTWDYYGSERGEAENSNYKENSQNE